MRATTPRSNEATVSKVTLHLVIARNPTEILNIQEDVCMKNRTPFHITAGASSEFGTLGIPGTSPLWTMGEQLAVLANMLGTSQRMTSWPGEAARQ